ncbi:MAG: hypothetical protein ABNH26_03485 [Celeribacter sp.]|jgi:putative colanic acid biosynthesis acetyltransferase WcaF
MGTGLTGGNVASGAPSFSLRNRLGRAVFCVTWTLVAAWTPAPLHRWRIAILRLFGADIAWSARLHGSVRIWRPANLSIGAEALIGRGAWLYCMDRIDIGAQAVVSQRAHLCTGSHRLDDPAFRLITAPIRIAPRAWIAAEAFVGPGVSVAHGAVVAARAVTMRNVPPWQVVAGNPARPIGQRSLHVAPDVAGRPEREGGNARADAALY